MLTVYYSPHMTSTDNEANRASGHADIPLSLAGVKRAQALTEHYRPIAFDAVFSSDLQRAVQTSAITFAERDVPRFTDSRLRECDYGTMTQGPTASVHAEFPRRITTPFPGGESVLMVADRVGAFLREISQKFTSKIIVVIGHRATNYALHYWANTESLDAIVNRTLEWREIPIWRYEYNTELLAHRP